MAATTVAVPAKPGDALSFATTLDPLNFKLSKLAKTLGFGSSKNPAAN